jgi:hypothetical protein
MMEHRNLATQPYLNCLPAADKSSEYIIISHISYPVITSLKNVLS